MILLFLAACEPVDVKLEEPEDADDLADLCEDEDTESFSETIQFAAWDEGCAWEEDGNLGQIDAQFSAQRVETKSIELPDDTAVCDFKLDFAAPGGGESTPMVYDDNFVCTFNNIVLATSYEPLLDVLPQEDGYYVWDWDSVVGTELRFETDIPSWCLGEDEGVSDCTIPLPEEEGSMSLSFGDSIVEDLSFIAYERGEYTFAFITLGDNDATDCSHEDFSFEVEMPYIEF